MQNKKGQANLSMVMSVVGIVILLVALGIIFSTGFKANTELTKMAEDASTSHLNETLTWGGNNSQMSLLEGRVTAVTLYNNGSKVNAGAGVNANYTFSSGSITVINSTPGTGDAKGAGKGLWVTDKLNTSYTYSYGSQERNTTLLSSEGIKAVSDFQPTWALIVGVGILLTAFLIPLIIWIFTKI